MDNIGLYFKATLTSLLAALSLRLDGVGNLILLFIVAAILDYVTGIAAAIYHKELSSSIGLKGVMKKTGECFIIGVALLSDEVVMQTGASLGITFSTGGAIVTVVTIWLILNELISILENIAKMNVALPPFLMSAIKLLKKQNEDYGKKFAPDETEEEERK